MTPDPCEYCGARPEFRRVKDPRPDRGSKPALIHDCPLTGGRWVSRFTQSQGPEKAVTKWNAMQGWGERAAP